MDRRTIKKDGVVMNKSFPDLEGKTADGSQTLFQLLQHRQREHPDFPFLGSIVDGQIVYKTYDKIFSEAAQLGAFLEQITEENDIVGLYSVNRTEWVIAEFASYFVHCCNCPMYSTFAPDALRAILMETELKVLVTSADKGHSLLDNVLNGDPHHLKHVILMDDDDKLVDRYEKLGIKAYSLKEILGGKKGHLTRVEPAPSDIATICYTSGTSGNPKGVILTHENFLAALETFSKNKEPKDYIVLNQNDTYLSYLPLPHVLERVAFYIACTMLVKVVFFGGNPKLLQADMKVSRPTFIITVPRVLNLFAEKINASVEKKNFLVRGLFNLGIRFKIWRQKRGVYTNWLLDKLIFNKVAHEFGGSIKYLFCGGASLNPSVLQFIQAVMSVKVFQGYGQTEGLAANLISPMDLCDVDTVGVPFPSVLLKLAPVEGYDGPDVGELLMKGKSITKGYFKKPKETKNLFTEDGWLRSGDVAREKNGCFYIVGRVKEIFKTSFGEYIIPEKVENLLTGGVVDDIFVTNSKFSDFLLAIVVCLDKEMAKEEIVKIIKKRASSCVEEKTLAKYEIPLHYVVLNEPFASYDSGSLITPSFKKRRNFIAAYFKDSIEVEFSKGTVNK